MIVALIVVAYVASVPLAYLILRACELAHNREWTVGDRAVAMALAVTGGPAAVAAGLILLLVGTALKNDKPARW